MIRPQTVWVRNNGSETFKNRFDGEDFEIEPGRSEEMTIECAALVFGYGEEDKTRAVRRLGLAFTRDEMTEALKKLDEFSFHMTEKEAREHNHSKTPLSTPGEGGKVKGKAPWVTSQGAETSGQVNLMDKIAGTAAGG